VPNEAAFYAQDRRASVERDRREFSIATNQVDFAQPRSFDLRYKDRDNTEKTRSAFIARRSARMSDLSDF